MRDVRWSFRFLCEEAGGVPVIVCLGRISSTTAGDFCRALSAANGHSQLVIDLAGVDYLSSAGFGPLSAAGAALKARGGAIVLCGLSVPVRMALELGGLLPEFGIAATREEAVQQLSVTRRRDPS